MMINQKNIQLINKKKNELHRIWKSQLFMQKNGQNKFREN